LACHTTTMHGPKALVAARFFGGSDGFHRGAHDGKLDF